MSPQIEKILNIRPDQAGRLEIRERIIAGSEVTGTNMYLLVLAILIASIGLNMNSTAIVIGAMLISPLMGVIMSIAYGIASRNTQRIRTGLSRFAFQIAVSLATSTLYFAISPISAFSSELAARTTPTIWDALIALLGGFAAIIATTRKSSYNNVIPGAAIATALMPPLCTTGFCLATARWALAARAFYLFSLNSIFICLASVIALQLMHATKDEHIGRDLRSRLTIFVFILVVLVPSVIMGFSSVRALQAEDAFGRFVRQRVSFDNTQVVTSSIDTANRTASIALIGSTLDQTAIDSLREDLEDYGLGDYTLSITQAQVENGVTQEELDSILSEREAAGLRSELQTELDEANAMLDLQASARVARESAAADVLALYPDITAAGFADLLDEKGESQYSLVLIVEKTLDEKSVATIETWLKGKLGTEVTVVQIVRAKEATGTGTSATGATAAPTASASPAAQTSNATP